MSQLYSNAVDTTLAAPLTDSATEATLTDGSGLNAPTGSDYELLVLETPPSIEIVRITARTGNTITITRAQEGTTAQSWPSGARAFSGVTAGTLEGLLVNQTTQTNSLALGGASVTTSSSVSIGPSADATTGDNSVSIGNTARARSGNAVAVGRATWAGDWGAAALTAFASAYDTNDIAIGVSSTTFGGGSISIGDTASAGGLRSISIGYASDASGDQSVAIGAEAIASRDHALVIAALPCITRWPSSAADAAWGNAGVPAIVTSGVLDLKNLQTYEIPLPASVRFFPEEVGIVVTAASGVTVQPTVQFGINGSAEEHLDAAATTGLTAAWVRQRFQTLKSGNGVTTLRFEVTVAATGSTLSARIYWRGLALETA